MQTRFRGISAVNMDSKGRIAIPVKYRNYLLQERGACLVVTIDTNDKCLLLYPLPEWEEIEKQIESLPSFDQQARRIQRLLIGYATEVDMDKNGRILLSPMLRDYADLDKQLVLVGQGKRFELWSKKIWDETTKELHNRSSDEVPESMKWLSL
ncbi:MAG: cell division/cell wall cluster transcriptional repressor MraZ [Legionellales bacterium]|nr:cell division/cell wall cluster transcriptional repressor MraZ [Legionellales bacterium]